MINVKKNTERGGEVKKDKIGLNLTKAREEKEKKKEIMEEKEKRQAQLNPC